MDLWSYAFMKAGLILFFPGLLICMMVLKWRITKEAFVYVVIAFIPIMISTLIMATGLICHLFGV